MALVLTAAAVMARQPTAPAAAAPAAAASAAAPAASPPAWTAYVTNYLDGDLTAINTSTDQAASNPINLNNSLPGAVAITPNGETAYVASAVIAAAVQPVDLTTNPPTPGNPISIGASVVDIAITPDGQTVYAVTNDDTVVPIDTATNVAGAPIQFPDPVQSIAIAPNGQEAFVTESVSTGFGTANLFVVPILLYNEQPQTPIAIDVSFSANPSALAFAPTGRTLYVSFSDGNNTPYSSLAAVHLDTGAINIITLYDLFQQAGPIVITPNGDTAYVSDNSGASGSNVVQVVNLTTDPPSIEGGIEVDEKPYSMAMTPDGSRVFVASYHNNAVQVIDTSTNTLESGVAIPTGDGPFGIAITPDQAPVAHLTVTAAIPGSPSTFDASASTVAYGTIANYQWNFGDGSSANTTTPTTTHSYTYPGTYTATVTETSQGGTSTTQTFTGHMASNNGGPSATTSATFSVAGLALTASPSTVNFGTAVTLTASITPTSGPTGTVTFTDTANGIMSTVASNVPLANGTASTSLVLPAVGANSITATYSGDSTYQPETSAPQTVTVNPVAHQLVVTQARFSGPGSSSTPDDWYVDVMNNSAFTQQLTGWNVNLALGGTSTFSIPLLGVTLAPGASYLMAGSAYSLDQVATPDFVVGTQFSGLVGVQVAPPGAPPVDQVGYSNAPVGYQGWAGGLAPLSGPSPGVQYAFVRHGSQAAPVDTDNNATDFSLVSTTGGTVGGVQSLLGAPSPLSTTSPQQVNANASSAMFQANVSASTCPNRIYTPAGTSTPATMVVNRTITNTSAVTLTTMKLRITNITEQNGPPNPSSGHAWLRLISSATTTYPNTSCPMAQSGTAQGTTLDSPSTADSGGGLGSTVTVPLPLQSDGTHSLPTGQSVNVALAFDVDQGGTFSFGYDVDAK
jgi:YVTN family beta-propeller protein